MKDTLLKPESPSAPICYAFEVQIVNPETKETEWRTIEYYDDKANADECATLNYKIPNRVTKVLDRQIRKATEAEDVIRELVAITEDMSNGSSVGDRLIVAWNAADEILEDNVKGLF